jgi:hypothetical protein
MLCSWNYNDAQKGSWQTIRPREFFVFPREGNEAAGASAGSLAFLKNQFT